MTATTMYQGTSKRESTTIYSPDETEFDERALAAIEYAKAHPEENVETPFESIMLPIKDNSTLESLNAALSKKVDRKASTYLAAPQGKYNAENGLGRFADRFEKSEDPDRSDELLRIR